MAGMSLMSVSGQAWSTGVTQAVVFPTYPFVPLIGPDRWVAVTGSGERFHYLTCLKLFASRQPSVHFGAFHSEVRIGPIEQFASAGYTQASNCCRLPGPAYI